MVQLGSMMVMWRGLKIGKVVTEMEDSCNRAYLFTGKSSRSIEDELRKEIAEDESEMNNQGKRVF